MIRFSKRRIAFTLFAIVSTAPAENFDTWFDASPDKKLFAVERRIPDASEPSRLDLDGFVVFICNTISGSWSGVRHGDVVAERTFPRRVVSQIRWSPDSNFLLFTTASSGGHSPWHFKTYVFCAADKSFRDVETVTGGSIGAADFHFEAPDVAVLKLYDPDRDEPKPIQLPLAKAAQQMARVE